MSRMEFRCLTVAETRAHRTRWEHLRDRDPILASPLLSLDLLQAVDAARGNVQVAVALRGGEPVAFLPFHRGLKRRARGPLGHLGDYATALAEPDCQWDFREMLEACRLDSLDLDNLACPDAWPAMPTAFCEEAPIVNVSAGFPAYCETRREIGSRELRETLRKERKLRRELPDVRFEFDCRDASQLSELLRIKSRQLRAFGAWDGLSQSWVSALFHQLANQSSSDCRGVLSVLRSGDRVVAACYGIYSRRVYHGWVTSFDRAFRRYSPGSILLACLLRGAAEQGIQRVDMGGGPEAYKRCFATHHAKLGAAHLHRTVLSRAMSDCWRFARQALRTSRCGQSALVWWNSFRNGILSSNAR